MPAPSSAPLVIDRYAIYREIASGGMATVHLARLIGPAGFTRTVAVKRLLPHLIRDESFAAMLIDEARLAARIRHPNVVSTLDVISTEGELLLVMDYVHGESLSKLWRKTTEAGERIPISIAASILIDVLHGLHAAHEATAEDGSPLNLVHRDVSPQNILVGADGITRIADFGIAKALGRVQVTRDRTVKGKLSYMSPEQIRMESVSRTTDVFAAGIVLWEVLSGKRLFFGDNDAQIVHKVLSAEVPPVSEFWPDVPPQLDNILGRALSRSPADRFPTARDMALAIEDAVPAIRASEIGKWVELTATESLSSRSQAVSDIERGVDSILESARTIVQGVEESVKDDVNAYGESLARSGISAPVSWSRGGVEPTLGPHVGTRTLPIAPGMPTRAEEPAAAESTEPSAPDRPSRTGWIVVGAALLLPIAAAAIFINTQTTRGPDAPVPSAPVTVAATRDAAADRRSEVPSAAGATNVTTPVPSAISSTALAPLATSARPRTAKPPAQRAARAPKQADTNCDPPYSIDAQGRRIFKLECM